MQKHLVLIVDRISKAELASYIIETPLSMNVLDSIYTARRTALSKFEEEFSEFLREYDYCATSTTID